MTPFERADNAKRLLNDPLLKQTFADIRLRLVDQLEATAFGDVETQHEVALMLQLLKRLRSQLEHYLQDQALIDAQNKQEAWLRKARQTIGI